MKSVRALLLVVGVSLVAVLVTARAQPAPSAASRLIGTWALAEYQSADPDMKRFRGERPTGLIYYDRTGHMAVQISPDRARRKFTGAPSSLFSGPRPTPEEAIDALSGYAAYFGTYTVDERAQTVTHKRLGNINPGSVGDFVRRFEFQSEDRLLLVPLERTDQWAVRLTWVRQR